MLDLNTWVIVFVITIVVLLIVGASRGSYGSSAEEQKRDSLVR